MISLGRMKCDGETWSEASGRPNHPGAGLNHCILVVPISQQKKRL